MLYTLPIIILVLLISTVVFLVLANKKDSLLAGGLGMISLVFLFFTGLSTLSEFNSHSKDLGAVRSSIAIMQFANERVSVLEDAYKNKYGIQAPTAALINGDRPVEGLAKELATAVRDRSIAQRKLLGSTVRIEQRKAGFYAFIPELMGDK